MAQPLYGIGDIVTLVAGPLRNARSEGEFRILALLPQSEGQAQYHVRSERENFDRRILSSEIDVEKSAPSRHTPIAPPARATGAREPWFKPLSIKKAR